MSRHDPLIGRRLSNYQVERLLGRGGMASVYYGVDVHLQRAAAIKVIDERHSDDPAYSERFVREARAMASWRHPNIPHIYQAGVEEGYSFYAMEYIQGLDLEKVLYQVAQQGRLLPFKDVLAIGRAVADALDYAHARGAIHRDVKPANILISEDDRILLTDFGLVLVLDKGTRGEVFGSPHYMAPEQARNSSEAVPQSDLYALGVILYEMLAGSPPFDDPSPASLAIKHITLEPPAPRQINPDLSPEIEAVLLKALRKQPQERYQTGKAMMDGLEEAMALPPAASQPPPTLLALPGDTDAHRSSTLARLAAQAPNPGQAQRDWPGQAAPAPLAPRALAPKPWRRPLSKAWLVPAAAVAVMGLLAIVCAALLIPRLPFAAATLGPGTRAAPATLRAALLPSETPPPSPLPSPTLAAATPSPQPSPVGSTDIRILIAKQRDDSMFLINRGTVDLRLASIRFGDENDDDDDDDNRGISGDEWEIDTLRPGQCVTVWNEQGNPRAPEGIQCEIVGERLERSGRDKFWEDDFDLYHGDLLVGDCKKESDDCEFTFSNTP